MLWETESFNNQVTNKVSLDVGAGTDVKDAISRMKEKVDLLVRVKLGVHIINDADNVRMMDKTNKRIHAAM